MHSGIGPRAQLEQFAIPLVLDQPSIGQNLRDHNLCPLVYARSPGSTDRGPFYGDQVAMDAALDQWKRDGTGPWAKFACELGIGFFKLDHLPSTAEFNALPPREQAHLSAPTVPHYEILTHAPMHWLIPDFPRDSLNYACLVVFPYNNQARGAATLQSADPRAPLRFDPRFLSHPFDRRVAVDALRAALRMARHEGFARDSVATLAGPPGEGEGGDGDDSDEALLAYWRQTVSSGWHMTGTVRMGRAGQQDDAAVDSEFRLVGVEGLRVADMSVVPVLPSGHKQAVAYVTGMTCAEKMIAEYGLA